MYSPFICVLIREIYAHNVRYIKYENQMKLMSPSQAHGAGPAHRMSLARTIIIMIFAKCFLPAVHLIDDNAGTLKQLNN